MAEDSELKCKAGRRPHNRNMQLWLQVCCEEGKVLSVPEPLSVNQKSMGSKVRTDRAGFAEFSMSQRKGGGWNWQKGDENKRKQTNKTSEAATLWFCCNPSSMELCFSPLIM